jgi:hypothetical protein
VQHEDVAIIDTGVVEHGECCEQRLIDLGADDEEEVLRVRSGG